MGKRLSVVAVPLVVFLFLLAGPTTWAEARPRPEAANQIVVPTPTRTPPVIVIPPSPTPPSSGPPTRTPTPTVTRMPTRTPTLPSFAVPSATPTDDDLAADLPPTPTVHWDPYVPDFPVAVASFTPTPSDFSGGPAAPQVDLSVTHIEVTQGMQSLDNDMPLMEIRTTFARVYVRSFGGDWFPVHGILQAWRGGEYLGMRDPENGPIAAFINGGDRTETDHTLNFLLPVDWRYGDVTLRAFIYSDDPQSPFEEEAIWVNNFRTVEVEFHQGEGVSLSLWPIHLHAGYDGTQQEVVFTADELDAATVLAGLKRLLPIQGVYVHDPPVEQLYCLGWSGEEQGVGQLVGGADQHPCEFNLMVPDGPQYVNAVMNWIDLLTDGPWDDALNYGMVHPFFVDDMIGYTDEGIAFTYTGIAWAGQTHGVMDVSTWDNTPWQMKGGETMAHEIGHRLGLGHVECTGFEGKAGTLDESFPWTLANCKIANLHPSGFYGFDVEYSNFPGLSGPIAVSNDPGASEPHLGFPLMSYQPPKWLDAYYWCGVLDTLGVPCDKDVVPFLASRPGVGRMAMAPSPEGSADAQPRTRQRWAGIKMQAASGYLLVGGQIEGSTGVGEIRRVMQLAELSDEALNALFAGEALFRSRTAYALALINGRGEVIGEGPIYDESDAHDRTANLFFLAALAFDPAASAIQVREGDRVLAEARISAHAPEVRLLAPNGGETLAAPLDIRWEGADADGDRLDFTVQYSPDDGDSWQAIVVGHLGTALRLDSLAVLTGSSLGKFRVIASDGVLTAEDTSDGVFLVPNTAPRAALTSPAHRRVYPQGATVVLSGSATDREDGVLPETSLSWTSEVDGPLGTGAELALRNLSTGRHILTLTAVDSEGAAGTARVAIGIDPAVVVRHLSDVELEQIATVLAEHGAAGPGIPEEAAAPPAADLATTVIAAGLLLLAMAGAGLVVFGLRRRPRG